MSKKAPTEFGHITEALTSMGKKAPKPKTRMDVSVTMRHGDDVYPDDRRYHKEQVKRLKKEIKAAQDQLKGWDHEEVGKKAKRSLERDLAAKTARLMESQALANDDEDDDEDDEIDRVEAEKV